MVLLRVADPPLQAYPVLLSGLLKGRFCCSLSILDLSYSFGSRGRLLVSGLPGGGLRVAWPTWSLDAPRNREVDIAEAAQPAAWHLLGERCRLLPGLSSLRGRRSGKGATEEVAHWRCIRGRLISERLTACERIMGPVRLRAGLGLARLSTIVEEVTLVGALRHAEIAG